MQPGHAQCRAALVEAAIEPVRMPIDPMVERLVLKPYRLALRRTWRGARGRVRARAGWLVSVSAGATRGYGDCAPLPEAGTEPLDAARARLSHWRARIAAGASLQALLGELWRGLPSPTPAADCALESALLDLGARRAGLTLRRLLSPMATDRVAVNAALGPLSELTPALLAAALDDGYRVLKLKVGVDAPALEIARLRLMLAGLSAGVRIRLDANGAWSLGEARDWIAALNDLPIDSVEEPLRDWSDPALRTLQASAGFALALDESLPGRGWPIDPVGLPVRRIVLKPAVIGGLRPTLALARAAIAAGREVVLTSLVESAAGLWAGAQLAAALDSPLAHGLATAHWLARDLGEAPTPQRGAIRLSDTPGSGFEPARREGD